ncbi:MAG: protein kinase [Planctomycetota bacterium]|nr:protein kinase [Planctomycetota bacterium]
MNCSEKSCPSPDEWRQLLTDNLAAEVEAKLTGHLDVCLSCRAEIERVSREPAWLADRVADLRDPKRPPENALLNSITELQKSRPPSSSARGRGSAGVELALQFLQPSSQAGSLGRLGRYEILEVVGRGGMGIVLRAHDPRLNRIVAIKVMASHLAFVEDARRRFLREAQAAAAINHDNVVTIYAVEEAQGLPFIAMEFIVGVSLAERIRRDGPLRTAEILRIGMQIAAGLQAAHAQDVIHRDVKPANILLQSGMERVKIADFGLARVLDGIHLTQPGIVLGTPQFMSPEQARGKEADRRSDLFSLGSVLYAMCTGESPFRAETPLQAVRRVCDEMPRPISERNPHIPDWLTEIIDRLLAKALEDRYQSAAEVAQILQERLTQLQQPSEIVLSTLPATSAARRPAPETSPSIAVLPFGNLSADPDNEYFADGLAEELTNALAQVSGLRVVARTSAFQFKSRALDIREIGRHLHVSTVLEGSVRKSQQRMRITAQLIDVASGYQVWSERYDRDLEDVFAVQDEIARTIVSALKMKLPRAEERTLVQPHTDNVEAYSQYLRGRFYWNKREPDALRKAIEFYDQALALDPEYPPAHAGKAECYLLLGSYALADQGAALDAAKAAAVKALAADDRLAAAHGAMGYVLAAREYRWQEAESHFRRALELDSQLAYPRMAYAFTVLVPTGRLEQALHQTLEAQKLDPVSPMINSAPPVIYGYLRQYERALASFRAALAVDPEHPLINLWFANSLIASGQYDEALTVVRKAKAFHVLALETEAIIHAAAGRQHEAQECAVRLEDELHRGAQVATLSLARFHAVLGDADRAFPWLMRAFDERIVGLMRLPVDPSYDRLRADPRFRDLLRRMRLEPPSVRSSDLDGI